MGFTEQLCENLKITEKEREKRAELSALFQNAVSALDVDTKFYHTDKQGPMSIDLARRDKWATVYRMTLHMICEGEYDVIIGMQQEEGKTYLIDHTEPLTVEAWVYISKFFTIVYNTWLAEQEAARVVPVAKYLAKIAVPETPYYHNWIVSEYETKAWSKALPGVTSLVSTLDETSFMTLCFAAQNDAFLADKTGRVPQEGKAFQYMTKLYLQFHRIRLAEKHAGFNEASKIFDAMITPE